jgi:RecA-family ATPase
MAYDAFWRAAEADAAEYERQWPIARPYNDFGTDDETSPLWRYTWKSGSDNADISTFECRSGSRSDADRQALTHFHSLGLPPRIDTFSEAQEVLAELDVEVILDDDPSAGPDLLPTLDLAALSKTRAKAVEFAIERIAPMAEVTLFTGPGSGGKSLLGQQLCTVSAAAIGTLGSVGSCLGLAVKAGPAIYATCEDTGEHLHFRQERLCEALGVDMASLAGKLHLVSLRGELDNALEGKDENGDYAPSAAYHRLAATIRATGARIAVLDNVAHLFAGNENDRHDVTRFVNLLNRLARDTGAAIILIGHPNKSGDTYSGSTAWLNAVRSQVWIDTPRDSDGSVLDHDARVLTIGKANYAPKGDGIAFRWHQWAFVRDDDLPQDTRDEIAEIVKANGENGAFLACLRARTEQGDGRGVGPSPGPSYAPTQFEGMPQAKGYKKAVLKRAMDRLYECGRIKSETFYNKSKGREVTIIVEVPEPSPNALPNASRTLIPNAPEVRPNTPRAHSHISKDISGAGPGGPPPPDDDQDEGPDYLAAWGSRSERGE